MMKSFVSYTFIYLTLFFAQPLFAQSVVELTNQAKEKSEAGQIKEALELLKKAETLEPENPRLLAEIGLTHYHLGQLSNAIKYYNKGLALVPGDTAIHYFRGHSYMDSGDYRLALRDFSASFAGTNYRNISACYNIGMCYQYMGKHDSALRYYEATLKLDPSDKYAYYSAGKSYEITWQFKQALNYYSKAISLDKTYLAPLLLRASLHVNQFNDQVSAFKDWEAYSELDPKDPRPHWYKGKVLFLNAKKDPEKLSKSRDMFDKAIELDPSNADLYFERSAVWYEIGILNMVCSDLRTAQKLGHPKASQSILALCKD